MGHRSVTQMSPSADRKLSVVPLALVLALTASIGCSGGGSATPSGAAGTSGSAGTSGNPNAVVGTFGVLLKSDSPPPVASVSGSVKDGPALDLVIWNQAGKDGACTLYKPTVPFCATPCGGDAACVADDTCKPYPTAKDVGTVTLAGVKTAAAATSVELTNVNNAYQTATSLMYPPFDEGADVSIMAAGGPYGAFTIHAKAIAPLVLGPETLPVEAGKALALTWTAKGASADSTIHVKLDISHHGGTKGKIECDTADNGSLTIASSLMTQLVNLGVSGFPTVAVSRVARGAAQISLGRVELQLSHDVEHAVQVPGLVSCTADTDCPTGKTCQDDLSCTK
jgi:hypothetical protein